MPEIVLVVLGRSGRELLGGSLPPAPSRREDVSPRYLDVDTAARAGPQLLLGYLLPVHGHRVELDQQHVYGKGVVQPVLDMLVLRPEDPPVFVRPIEIRRTRLDLQADETARRAAFALHLDLRVHAEVGGALLPEDQAEPSHQDLAHPDPFAVGLVGIRRDVRSPPVLVLLPEDRRGHRHYGRDAQLGCLIDGRSAGTAPFKRCGRHLPDSCLVRPAGAWPAGGRPAVAAAHRLPETADCFGTRPAQGKMGQARIVTSRLAAAGRPVSRRALRSSGVTDSNAALNALARMINAERAGMALSAATPASGR